MLSKFAFSRLKVAEELLSHFQNFNFKKFVLTVYSYWAIYKRQNGESGNGMKGMMGTLGIRVEAQGIRVGMRGIMVGMRKIRVVGMRRIRVILCENLRIYCFG